MFENNIFIAKENSEWELSALGLYQPPIGGLATLGARCCLHCRRNEAMVSQMNSRYEFRTSGNPYRHKQHILIIRST